MSGCLDIDNVLKRIGNYAELLAARGELRKGAKHVLEQVFLQGRISRGDVARITGLSRVTASRLTSGLVGRGLLEPTTPKGPLLVAFPAHAVGYYFPRLYPESVEAESMERRS